jgi:hypothetical protein
VDELTEGNIREQQVEASILTAGRRPHPWKRIFTDYQAWKTPKPHPLTGDLLSPGERVTWKVMGIYRRWSVFIALQIITIFWWTHPHLFPGGLSGWNYLWSDLAVAVEMLVGIAFLNQSMRDAKIIRQEFSKMCESDEAIHQVLALNTKMHEENAELLAELHVHFMEKKDSDGKP